MLVTKPGSKLGCAEPVAFQAQGSKVRKVAFTAAFGYRNYVIRVPNRLAACELPVVQRAAPCSASQFAQAGELRDTVQSANSADALVAFEYSLTEMAWISAEPPFFHAPVGTKGPASLWNFEIAPAANAPTVFAFRNRVAADPAPWHRALSTHRANRPELRRCCELVIDGNSKASGQGVRLVG